MRVHHGIPLVFVVTFSFKAFPTLWEHQSILTNATVSKNSEIGLNMVVYENFFLVFQVFQGNVWPILYCGKVLGNREIQTTLRLFNNM